MHVFHVFNIYAKIYVNKMLYNIQTINLSFMHTFQKQKLKFTHFVDETITVSGHFENLQAWKI